MSDKETSQQRPGLVATFLAMPNDRPLKTLVVAVLLVLVCSLAISSAAVLLEPAQQRNKTLAMKREILKVAGLLEEGKSVDELF